MAGRGSEGSFTVPGGVRKSLADLKQRYLGSVPSGFRIERLYPGPLERLLLPGLALPLPLYLSLEDRMLLALYYRWGLQSLSALSFVHKKSRFLCDFGFDVTWVRSDLSLALTGFVNTSTVTYNEDADMMVPRSPPYDTRRAEGFDLAYVAGQYLDGSLLLPSAKYDLFDWATWVWRLMTNDHSIAGPHGRDIGFEPVYPQDGRDDEQGQPLSVTEQRFKERAFQKLDRRRLGDVLIKAWNAEYGSAEDVMEDVRAIARELEGANVENDEVTLDGVRWGESYRILPIGWQHRNKEMRFTVYDKESKSTDM